MLDIHEKKVNIAVNQKDFDLILLCATRYAIGRQTYMPHVVVDFIASMIPTATDYLLDMLDREIVNQRSWGEGAYGDEQIDKPVWIQFHKMILDEKKKRGMKPYVSPYPEHQS